MFRKLLNKISSTESVNVRNPAYKNRNILSFEDNLLNMSDNSSASPKDYLDNVIVHRCVNLIASSASHVPFIVKSSLGRNMDNHPLARILSQPNNKLTGADFVMEIVASLLLHGSTYILTSQINNKPAELFVLNPNTIEHVYKNSRLIGYRYKPPRGGVAEKIYYIDPISGNCPILQIKNFNPFSNNEGVSSLRAASRSINLFDKTLKWNKSLLENSAKPSGALSFADNNGYLTDEQFERLKQQFYQNFSGWKNGGRPLILEGGLQWQENSSTEKLEKFLELKDSSARDIAICFNVPPQLLGINGDNTYSNMQEARLALWEENIIPLLDKLSDSFSCWFSRLYKQDLIVDFNRDEISTLSQRRENLWTKISSANFMTINEKRRYFGLHDIEGGDVLETGEKND